MEDLRSILERFPKREFEIRRQCANDAHFRTICADYEEAVVALCRWREAAADGDRRVEEYESFVSELETEILTHLERALPRIARR